MGGQAPQKILALKLRALGDTVMLSAPLGILRQRFPESQIHAVLPEAWAPVLMPSDSVSKVWSVPARPRVSSLMGLASQLRKEKFDWVLAFHASPRTAAMARWIGGHSRAVHFHGHEDRDWFSTVEIPGKGKVSPAIERDLNVIRSLGVEVAPGAARTSVLVTPSESQAAAQRLQEHMGLQGSILVMGLGASRETKSWPIERFVQTAIEWVRQEKGSVVAFVAQSEVALEQAFLQALDDLLEAGPEKQRLKKLIRIERGLPLRLVAALFAQATVFVGNDSGLKHLAVAVGVPTVTLFGPEDPYEWHPYSRFEHPYFFIEGLSCRASATPGHPPWCGLDRCIVEQHQCMKRIGVAAVIDELRKLAQKRKAFALSAGAPALGLGGGI